MIIKAVVTVIPEPYVSPKNGKSYYTVFVADDEPNPAQRCMTELEVDLAGQDPASLGFESGKRVELSIRQFKQMNNGIPRVSGILKLLETKAPAASGGKAA